MEPTGNYHRPIAWRLREASFQVRLVSSVALARTREALHNGWDKNDPKDAQVILHTLRIGASQTYHDSGRRHQRRPGAIEDPRSDCRRQDPGAASDPDSLSAALFPGARPLPPEQSKRLVLRLPGSVSTPASITALDNKPAFIEAAWSVVGRKVSKERLLGNIYKTAKTSIGLPIPLEAPAIRKVPACHR